MSSKVCEHPSLELELSALLTVKDVNLTVSEMNERTLFYLAETVCRVKYPEKDEAETHQYLEQFRKAEFPVAVYVMLREIHDYLRTIPKLEKYR